MTKVIDWEFSTAKKYTDTFLLKGKDNIQRVTFEGDLKVYLISEELYHVLETALNSRKQVNERERGEC